MNTAHALGPSTKSATSPVVIWKGTFRRCRSIVFFSWRLWTWFFRGQVHGSELGFQASVRAFLTISLLRRRGICEQHCNRDCGEIREVLPNFASNTILPPRVFLFTSSWSRWFKFRPVVYIDASRLHDTLPIENLNANNRCAASSKDDTPGSRG